MINEVQGNTIFYRSNKNEFIKNQKIYFFNRTQKKYYGKNKIFYLRNCYLSFIIYHFSSACFKSAIKSSTSSIPTLKRRSESATPDFSRSSFGMLACVIDAG